jgi:steroid delta-isomerase-like uncharacterized protein
MPHSSQERKQKGVSSLSTDNRDGVHRLFEEAFNQGNFAFAEQLIDATYIDHSPIPAPALGLEGFKKRIALMRSVFSHLVFTVDDLLAEGEKIALRWTFRGRHTGTFAGRPPTDKLVTFAGINIEYLADGKIVEHWSVFDMQNLLQQLGVVPAAEQVR